MLTDKQNGYEPFIPRSNRGGGTIKIKRLWEVTNMELKAIVQGSADLSHMIAGGIAVYILTDTYGNKYELHIDLSDKHDVGDSACFELHYDKAIILMRWIRRAIEKNTLYMISQSEEYKKMLAELESEAKK